MTVWRLAQKHAATGVGNFAVTETEQLTESVHNLPLIAVQRVEQVNLIPETKYHRFHTKRHVGVDLYVCNDKLRVECNET